MKKSNVQEKSKGALLFAFNTKNTDYVKIAERAARLIYTSLGLPTSLVTDSKIVSTHFDKIIYADNQLKNYKPGPNTAWRNGDRYKAYEFSPYDETLLIDSDYLVLDDSLQILFEQDFDYRIMSYNTNYSNNLKMQTHMGDVGLPFKWATVILFRKTEQAKMLFDLVGRVQRNYLYYCKLYHLKYENFRNDFAFTIANNILKGYDLSFDQGIIWPMLTFSDPVTSISINKNLLTIKEKDMAYVIPKQNIHVMDKDYLLSDDYLNLVNTICQE